MFDYLISSTRPRKRKLKNSMQNGKYVQFLEMDSPGPATEGMHKGFVGHNAGNLIRCKLLFFLLQSSSYFL